MPPMRPVLLSLLIPIVLATGCAASRPMEVVVEVADASTGSPIEDVLIRSSGGTFYIPTMQPSALGEPGAMLGPAPSPEGSIGHTDATGKASLTVAGQRPVFLRFFHPDYPEGFITVQTGETDVIGATAWTIGGTIAAIDRTIPLLGDGPQDGIHNPPEMIFRVRVASSETAANPTGP